MQRVFLRKKFQKGGRALPPGISLPEKKLILLKRKEEKEKRMQLIGDREINILMNQFRQLKISESVGLIDLENLQKKKDAAFQFGKIKDILAKMDKKADDQEMVDKDEAEKNLDGEVNQGPMDEGAKLPKYFAKPKFFLKPVTYCNIKKPILKPMSFLNPPTDMGRIDIPKFWLGKADGTKSTKKVEVLKAMADKPVAGILKQGKKAVAGTSKDDSKVPASTALAVAKVVARNNKEANLKEFRQKKAKKALPGAGLKRSKGEMAIDLESEAEKRVKEMMAAKTKYANRVEQKKAKDKAAARRSVKEKRAKARDEKIAARRCAYSEGEESEAEESDSEDEAEDREDSDTDDSDTEIDEEPSKVGVSKSMSDVADDSSKADSSTSPTDEERVNRLFAWAENYLCALHEGKIKPSRSRRRLRAKPY